MIKPEIKLNKADPVNGTTANIYKSGFFKPPEKTQEGFLIVDVILGRKCVLPYKYKNPATGEVITIYELVGDDIYKPPFLNSAEGLPFVLEHPQNENGDFVNVTPENYKQFIKGTVTNPRIEMIDNEKIVIGTLKIFDPEVIDLVLTKRLSEVSQGYFCTTENSKGVYNNVSYDAVQKNMILNHLALVADGRAGDSVRLLYNSKTDNEILQFIQNSKIGVKQMIIKNKAGKEVSLKDLIGKNYRINQSETNPEEMIVEEVPAQKDNIYDDQGNKIGVPPGEKDNQDPNAGMAAVLMKVIEMILGKGSAPAPSMDNGNVPGADNGMTDQEKLMGNALNLILQMNGKSNPKQNTNNNPLVLGEARNMIAAGIRDFERAALNAKSIIGNDALTEALKFNTTDEFKREVLIRAGRNKEEVQKMNSYQVDAHFEAEAEKSRNDILNPVRNGGSHVTGEFEMVRD